MLDRSSPALPDFRTGLTPRPDFLWMKQRPGYHPKFASLRKILKKDVRRGEALKKFRKAVRKVINMKAFIRNSQELVELRKKGRNWQHKRLSKYYLKQLKKIKARLKELGS